MSFSSLLPSGVKLTFAIGLEYAATTKLVTPWISTSTGLDIELYASGTLAAVEGSFGAFPGEVSGSFGFGTESNPIVLSLGINPLETGEDKFYLKDPNPNNWSNVTARTGTGGYKFFEPSSTSTLAGSRSTIGAILDQISPSFEGAVSLNLLAGIPAIGAKASVVAQIPSLQKFILDPTNQTNIDLVTTFDAPMPMIEPPSFLDILLADPQAIVDTCECSLFN